MIKKILIFIFSLTLLTSCGGGGGGNTSGLSFTTSQYAGTYNSIDINMSGSSVASYSNQSSGNLSLTSTRRSDGLISYAKFSTAAGDQTFDTNNGATIATFTKGAIGLTSNNDGALFRLDTYSGYGMWEITTGNTSRVFVGQSGTSLTSNPAAVVSSASYTGYALGLLTEVGYAPIFTTADFSATANFSSGSMSVSTSNTRGISLSTGNDLGSYSADNISGTLSKSGSNNYTYTGTVTSNYASNSISGTATLQVYGPSAESVAGSAILTRGDGTRNHALSFGGTR